MNQHKLAKRGARRRTTPPHRRNPSPAKQLDARVLGRGAARVLAVQVRDARGTVVDSNQGRLDAMWPLFDLRDEAGLDEFARSAVYDFDLGEGDAIALYVEQNGVPRAVRRWEVTGDRDVSLLRPKGRAAARRPARENPARGAEVPGMRTHRHSGRGKLYEAILRNPGTSSTFGVLFNAGCDACARTRAASELAKMRADDLRWRVTTYRVARGVWTRVLSAARKVRTKPRRPARPNPRVAAARRAARTAAASPRARVEARQGRPSSRPRP